MINIELRKKSNPAKWWHRPVIAVQDWIAPNFVLVLTDSGTGYVYAHEDPSLDLIRHEAYHVVQALFWGDWVFRWRYLTSRAYRLRREAEAYGVQFKGDVDRVSRQLEKVASTYFFGTLSAEDYASIRGSATGRTVIYAVTHTDWGEL